MCVGVGVFMQCGQVCMRVKCLCLVVGQSVRVITLRMCLCVVLTEYACLPVRMLLHDFCV
jgi:hypothetical protein